MAHNLESNPEINKLKPYLALAKEYEPFFPISTYYLKEYTVNKLMAFYKKLKSEGNDDAIIKQTLNVWIGEIEQMKQKYGDLLQNKKENLKEIELFTMNVFLKADDDERANNFTIETMKAFQATSKLFEVLNYLGEPSEDFAQKKKYAMAKAIEINRKLKNPELYQPKPKEETKMDEEFPKNNDENQQNFMNHLSKNDPFQEGNPDKESVDRILKFVTNNKPMFEKYGITKLLEKSPINPNISNFNNNLPINVSNNLPIPNKNETNSNNLVIKSAMRGDKEMLSVLAGKKISQVAMRDRIQKDCQSVITDINSNRINQAKIGIENVLKMVRELKF